MHKAASLSTSETSVDAATLHALLRDQFPELASVPLGDRLEGYDHVAWRLGGHYTARLPRHERGAYALSVEAEVLPRIGQHLPFHVSAQVRRGQPGHGFPWNWYIVPWIEGVSAYRVPLNATGATQLGEGLAALHRIDTSGAPLNPLKSASLVKRLDTAEDRIRRLLRTGTAAGWHLDANLARTTYLMGARQPRPRPTWTHPDLNGNNVITNGGTLAGIVNWGYMGGGDPAADLGQAMILIGSTHWDQLLTAYGHIDTKMYSRALAEATDAALRLACIDGGLYARGGWQGLMDLGLATPPQAQRARDASCAASTAVVA